MITVLWSTPRTGSTWYSRYILDNIKKQNKNVVYLRQYLNHFHLDSYIGPSTDLIYEYDKNCCYIKFYIDPLSKKIQQKTVCQKRILSLADEENYRIQLLEKTNHERYPIFISQHVRPMNKSCYLYLKNKATKNIFIYRENIIDQMASYVVAMYTKTFVLGKNEKTTITNNASIPISYLESLYERIKYWHELDKTDCQIIKYEDIDFSLGDFNKKQNDIKPIEQVSSEIRDKIFELNDDFQQFMKDKTVLLSRK